MRLIPERFYNHCHECGVRIKWRGRAYLGNSYVPYVCHACADKSMLRLYRGDRGAMEAAYVEAARKLDAEIAAERHVRL